MNSKTVRMLAAIALVSASTIASTFAANVNELKKIAKDNCCNYTYGMFLNKGHMAKYVDGKSDAEVAKMCARYMDAMKGIVAAEPNNGSARIEYGWALMHNGKNYGAAYGQFQAASKLKLNNYNMGEALFGMAECKFAMGDKSAAMNHLQDLVNRKLNAVQRGKYNYSDGAAQILMLMRNEDLDVLKFPAYTDCKPIPTPQKAEYTDKFANVSTVSLHLNGIKADDARIDLLKKKFSRYGITVNNGGSKGYILTINVDPAKNKFAHAEEYTLVTTDVGATIEAANPQGALWGIVSFIQMTDSAKKVVRIANVSDYPDTERRGYTCDQKWGGHLEFCLFNKLNSIVVQQPAVYDMWTTPLRVWYDQEMCRRFNSFGLEYYCGIAMITMYPQIPIAYPSTEKIQTEVAEIFASAGGHLYFPFDDARYPLCKQDLAKFGQGTKCDAKHVTKIYRNVKAKYPNFKLAFCPPYYWGPDSKVSYPDDREEYLASIKAELDPEILVYWTGPMVKGITKKPYQVKWFTDLTGHKPLIFQNGTGPHNLLSYTADVTDWNSWHYDGFYQEIDGFHKNSHMPLEVPQIMSLANCLWNVKAYDPENSTRTSLNQMFGAKMFDILRPGVADLAYFDKYKYGDLTPDIISENIADLNAKVQRAEARWNQAVAYNPAIKGYGDYARGIGFAKDALKNAKNPPDFLKKFKPYIEETKALAEKEVGIDAKKGDLFYSPVFIMGGQVPFYYDHPMITTKRFVKAVRGVGTGFDTMTINFESDPFPPEGAYEMYLCGMDDEVTEQCKLRITINDVVVYDAVNTFPSKSYQVQKFTLPFTAIKRYNVIKIQNVSPSGNPNGTPYICINYIVLKKSNVK